MHLVDGGPEEDFGSPLGEVPHDITVIIPWHTWEMKSSSQAGAFIHAGLQQSIGRFGPTGVHVSTGLYRWDGVRRPGMWRLLQMGPTRRARGAKRGARLYEECFCVIDGDGNTSFPEGEGDGERELKQLISVVLSAEYGTQHQTARRRCNCTARASNIQASRSLNFSAIWLNRGRHHSRRFSTPVLFGLH